MNALFAVRKVVFMQFQGPENRVVHAKAGAKDIGENGGVVMYVPPRDFAFRGEPIGVEDHSDPEGLCWGNFTGADSRTDQ